MKAIDILKKAHEIEKEHVIIIKEPTKNYYGSAVRLSDDPELEIMKIDKGGDDFKIDRRKYSIEDSICINVKDVDKLIKAIKELKDLEI